MKKIMITAIFFAITKLLFGQTNFGNKWIVSNRGYNIDFNTSPVTHDTVFVLNTEYYRGGHSNICDSNKNLIFSCDGMDIYDKNFNLMDNGDTIVPPLYYVKRGGYSSIPQTSIILPFDNKKYYVVTPTVSDSYLTTVWDNKPALNWNFDLLLYHVVDMNANAGLGKVVKKKVPLLENSPMKKTQMMACRHANGKDWWLLKMAGDSNMVYTFLFTQDSVYTYLKQHIPFPLKGVNDLWGQMQFSKDGGKWATTCDWGNETANNGSGEIFTGDFNRCTGQLTNYQKYTAPSVSGDSLNLGLSFSPNGKLIYISKINHIQQLDPLMGSWYTVHGPDSPAYFCGYTTLHLAPDNKIYIGRADGICKQLSVIDSPDIKYNCDFCVNCLRSKSNYGYFISPPNMPNYELGADLPCWPLATDDLHKKNNNLDVFPNPASTAFYITTLRKEKRELYNSVGQLLYSTTGNAIDISHYSKGIYYIRCGNAVRKVVIE